MKDTARIAAIERLIRWSGFLFFLFGLLAIVLRIIQFTILGDPPLEILVLSQPFLWLQGFPSLAASIFFLLGASALYLRQADHVGKSGLVIYLISFSALMLSSGAMWTYAFTAPVLAAESPSLLTSTSSGIIRATLGSLALGQMGWLLMTIQAFITKVIPRWSSIVAISSIILVIALTPFAQTQFLRLIYNVLLGAGPLAIGFVLWRGRHLTPGVTDDLNA